MNPGNKWRSCGSELAKVAIRRRQSDITSDRSKVMTSSRRWSSMQTNERSNILSLNHHRNVTAHDGHCTSFDRSNVPYERSCYDYCHDSANRSSYDRRSSYPRLKLNPSTTNSTSIRPQSLANAESGKNTAENGKNAAEDGNFADDGSNISISDVLTLVTLAGAYLCFNKLKSFIA